MFLLGGLLFKIARAVSSLAVIAVVAAAGFVVYQSRQTATAPTDAIVVLGASQFNGRPSPVLANRLEHAQSLYSSKLAAQIITVGGNQPGDKYTEAAAGKAYLAERGVPAEVIVAVPYGSDTFSSLRAVSRQAQKRGIKTVTIVSDAAHVARARLIAGHFGLDAAVAPTEQGPGSELTFDYVLRETLGILNFEIVTRWTN